MIEASSEAKVHSEPSRPSHTPACHPNSKWIASDGGHCFCEMCGRTDDQANAHAGIAGLELSHSLELGDAKAQLYRALLDIMLEDATTPDTERMARWQRLSSGFWGYQHKLFDDLKARGYFSKRWDAQRTWSLNRAEKRVSAKPALNDSLTLADLGL